MNAPEEFFFYAGHRRANMNYLVFLDAQAGELEKILSGVKTMLVTEFQPPLRSAHSVNPGDSLYFLKNQGECAVRVKATVVRVLFFADGVDGDLPGRLKEMQPRLCLTEEQFNYWSTRDCLLFVEFDSAQKIPVMNVAPEKIKDGSRWIAFEEFGLITMGSFECERNPSGE